MWRYMGSNISRYMVYNMVSVTIVRMFYCFLCFIIFMCSFMCAGAYACVYGLLWRPKNNSKFYPLFFPLWNKISAYPSSLISLSWLASELRGSACLCLPGARIASVGHPAMFSQLGSKALPQVFVLAWQALYGWSYILSLHSHAKQN